MEIDKAIERLAFIKYLYNVGVEQSRKPEPFCWASVLTFHDAIELFLELSAEYLDVSKRVKELRFPQYWDLLNPILKRKEKDELTQKIAMDKLNETRKAFKHHGTPPSKSAIDDCRINTTNFFEENTPTVFDIEFSEISLIDLIQYENSKKSLKQAQKLLNSDRKKDALCKAAISFIQLIDDYENKKKDEFGRSPFFFGTEWEPVDRTFIRQFKALQDAVKILSLGLDYRRYSRFRLLTPTVLRIVGGKYKIQWIKQDLERIPNTEAVQFCIDFVIESAIILQEFDFEVKPRKRRTLADIYQ